MTQRIRAFSGKKRGIRSAVGYHFSAFADNPDRDQR
jgi:hypothetical protein